MTEIYLSKADRSCSKYLHTRSLHSYGRAASFEGRNSLIDKYTMSKLKSRTSIWRNPSCVATCAFKVIHSSKT